MTPAHEEAIRQIDEVLVKFSEIEKKYTTTLDNDFGRPYSCLVVPDEVAAEMQALQRSTMKRLAPGQMKYAEGVFSLFREMEMKEGERMSRLHGVLRALKDDYKNDRLRS